MTSNYTAQISYKIFLTKEYINKTCQKERKNILAQNCLF